MTSPSGYRRLTPSSETFQARIWVWMRTRRKPWTALACSEATGASERQTRRYIARLSAAGYLVQCGEEGGEYGQIPARLWEVAEDPGPIPPVLVGGAAGEGVEDLNSDMTGAELRAMRRTMGLSATEFGRQVLGVSDQRTVRRYETLPIVPSPVALRARGVKI